MSFSSAEKLAIGNGGYNVTLTNVNAANATLAAYAEKSKCLPNEHLWHGIKSKGNFLYRPVHSDTISASLGSIQPYTTINARRLLVHISTTVYNQVLIYTAE